MNKYNKKVTFSQNNYIFEMDNYDRTNDELTSIILDKERFSRRIKNLEKILAPFLISKMNNENSKLTYNKKIYNKMVRSEKVENSKFTYNKKIYNKMTTCQICNTNIKNFKIHEQSNKHIRNTNQLLPFSLLKLKKKLCSLCNKSILNLKIHEKSKKHQINLMSCHYKNCRKGLQGNFKAYCYTNIKMIDPRAFINNMMKTIENKFKNKIGKI